MKLSDYVFEFLACKGVKLVFLLPGGGCMHLADSLGCNTKIEYVCCLHEQAAAIAAEAYAQHTGNIGAALVTTGPGGTNTVTGVAAAWIDSTPCIFISGQVKSTEVMKDSGVRQMGPQEVNIVDIIKPVTKYAATVLKPEQIRYHLEKAYHLAVSGRKGPVWLDIPLDVQAAAVCPEDLPGYSSEHSFVKANYAAQTDRLIELLKAARRPAVLAGSGIKAAAAEAEFLEFIEKAQLPALYTWKVIDMLDEKHPLNFGSPGVLGHRGANFILQNSDLLIVLGSRLDSSLTAFNHTNFAPKAKKIMVDIDAAEINKMQLKLELAIIADAKELLKEICLRKDRLENKDRSAWLEYCNKVKRKYPVVLPEYYAEKEYVNSYVFIAELCRQLTEEDIIVPESSGSAGEVTYQAFRVKKGQKIKNAAGLGSMGFGLPYAIGACLANEKKRTILINGDGAFQLNIQELATIAGLCLPIKMFLWNNGGYASIMATQRNFCEGRYVGSNKDSRLFLPDVAKVAEAYGIRTFRIYNNSELEKALEEVLKTEGPVLCEVMLSPMQAIAPKVQAKKLPDGGMISGLLEDMWPYLGEQELQENMISGVDLDERL